MENGPCLRPYLFKFIPWHAQHHGRRGAEAIIDEVQGAIADWEIYAKDSFVSDDFKKQITKALMEIGKG